MSNRAITCDCCMINFIATCFISGALFFLIFGLVLTVSNCASPGTILLMTFLPILFIVIGCFTCYCYNKENCHGAFRTSECPKEDTTDVVSAQQPETSIHMSPQVPIGVMFLLN